MNVTITAWVDGEYIHSETAVKGETLEDLLKQVCIKNGRTLFDLLGGKDKEHEGRYMIKINNKRLSKPVFDIPLKPDDHVVVINLFQFGSGG